MLMIEGASNLANPEKLIELDSIFLVWIVYYLYDVIMDNEPGMWAIMKC